jgi:membrane-associated phospholipid phosphatase
MKTIIISLYLLCANGLPCAAQHPDINLLKQINRHETRFKNKFLELQAAAVTPVSIGLPAAIAITGFIKQDKQLQKDALYMCGGYILTAVITQSVKRAVDRRRPFQDYLFIVKRDDESGGLSFPSGHTSAAFSTAASVALRYKKWYVVLPAGVFATSVAWARMYQGVHYPSDVFAGAVIGAGSAWLSYKAQKKWFVKKYSEAPSAALF